MELIGFSIVAVAEGAMTVEQAKQFDVLSRKKDKASKADKSRVSAEMATFHDQRVDHTVHLTQQLEQLTGIESRITILGHLQRGGIPSAGDRLLATRLGTACAELLNDGQYGVMVAADGGKPVSLKKVADNTKLVPPDHPWLQAARLVGTCLGE